MSTLTKGAPAAGHGGGTVAEQYHALVHWLQASGNDALGDAQSIGITSCGPRAGVSTAAANLAVAAAGTCDRPVLLLDLSSTRPSFAKRLELNGDLGLLAALEGAAHPSECAKATPIANLSMLAINTPGAPELPAIDGGRVHSLLRELERDFGFIVVDLPPAETGLCFLAAGAVGGVLLVLETERTGSDLAYRAKQRLIHANAVLVGAILQERTRRPQWLDPRP